MTPYLRRRTLGILGLWLLAAGSLAAQSIADLKAMAALFMDNGKYYEALALLHDYEQEKPKDDEARYWLGLCYFHTGDDAAAQRYLEYATEQRKHRQGALYHLALTHHYAGRFAKASALYKTCLAEMPPDEALRDRVKAAVRQCAEGLKWERRSKVALIENMGENINGQYNEMRPIVSPNFNDVLYYAAETSDNSGGPRDIEGRMDSVLGRYTLDMKVSRLQDGRWSAGEPLSLLLNSPKHDFVLGFSNEGRALYFFQGLDYGRGEMFIDTFSTDASALKVPGRFLAPLRPDKGDVYAQIVSDTALVFAATREEGQGQRDIYVSVRDRYGVWSLPQPLEGLNSPYDDIAPFLAKDGMSLYFSSNRPESIGGYDVFKSIYDPSAGRWSAPVNVGMPINSGANELGFVLGHEGLKGYVASDRFGGLGGYDLYAVYFKAALPEQQVLAQQAPMAGTARLGSGDGQNPALPGVAAPEAPKTYVIAPLYFSGDEVLDLANKKKLDVIFKLLNAQPQLQVEIIGHADNASDPANFRLYFSLKRAEQVAQYLVSNGVAAKNVLVKGLGDAYPVAYPFHADGSPNRIGMDLNRRIDFIIHGAEGLPANIEYSQPMVNAVMKADNWASYQNLIKGLSYKVQIGAVKQMYDSQSIGAYPDVMIESAANSEVMRYSVGLMGRYAEAEALRQDLFSMGLQDAFVVPYINGLRKEKEELAKWADIYPDLRAYLEAAE